MTILTTLIAIAVFVLGIAIAERERYVHGFRSMDMNVYSYALKAVQDDINREIAKLWLKRSEDFRNSAIYYTFTAVNCLFCVLFLAIALLLLFLFDGLYIWLPLCLIAVVFLLLVGLIQLGRYHVVTPITKLEEFSWKVAEMFPPLLPPLVPSHLVRWPEIEEVIQSQEWLITYLETLPEHNRWLKCWSHWVKSRES
jgi:hypothetical protein